MGCRCCFFFFKSAYINMLFLIY